LFLLCDVAWQKKPSFLTPEKVLQKLEKYCAYQERSQLQVENKCREYGMTSEETGQILVDLIQSNFINEERFALAYVKGKFNQKSWGPKKIEIGLKQAGIRKALIDRALSKIIDNQQADKIENLARKKIRLMGYSNEGSLSQLKSQLNFLEQQKVIKYLFQKGYLLDEINKVFC
jgi:regulatory protein